MRKVYRVLRKLYARTPLDGEGAYLYGGRWSSAGTRLAYTSEHQSLAMLEYFVHLDPDDAPPVLFWSRLNSPATFPPKLSQPMIFHLPGGVPRRPLNLPASETNLQPRPSIAFWLCPQLWLRMKTTGC